MQRVTVIAADDLTAAYPQRTAVRVHLVTNDGYRFDCEQSDFEGSPTNPMSWARVVEKSEGLLHFACISCNIIWALSRTTHQYTKVSHHAQDAHRYAAQLAA